MCCLCLQQMTYFCLQTIALLIFPINDLLMKNYKYINPCREKNINTSCVLYRNSHLKALPTERGKVKPVDCPLVDERPRVLKKQWQNEAGKERTISVRSSCLQAWVAHHSILFFIPLNVS